MILATLGDYYHRANLAPPGWELRAIPYFLVIDRAGRLLQVVHRADQVNKNGAPLLVPMSEIRSGKNAWAKPNLLWDHYGFVLGEPKRMPDGSVDPLDSIEKAKKQLEAFYGRAESLLERYPESPGLRAIFEFCKRGEYKNVLGRPDAVELFKAPGTTLTFRLNDQIEPVFHEPWVHEYLNPSDQENGDEDSIKNGGARMCLVTGKIRDVSRLHPKIYGVASKPTPLAAANTKEARSYSSYGKAQGYIFPVSQAAAFAYATALNHLLAKGSSQRVQVGDTTIVFWAERETAFETLVPDIFGEPPRDDPDRGVGAVRALFEAIHSGKFGGNDGDIGMYVLGLTPNAARISIRCFHCLPLRELANSMQRYFDDLEIVRGRNDPQYPSLKRLLQSICPVTDGQPFGDIERLPPVLAGQIVNSVFAGPNAVYPSIWLNVAVGRCRAEQNVNYMRAASIKACLNRQIRSAQTTATLVRKPSFEKEFLSMLDPNNTHPPYRIGRLFAVLERIQEQSAGGVGKLNSTIRDRFYGAASSSPATVFPMLLKLKNHHVSKLDEKARRILYRAFEDHFADDYIGKITLHVQQIPMHLTLPEQGSFALGYYHQRQAFFTERPIDPTEIDGENQS